MRPEIQTKLFELEDTLPKEEEGNSRLVLDALQALSHYSDDFSYALQLFDFCAQENERLDSQHVSGLLELRKTASARHNMATNSMHRPMEELKRVTEEAIKTQKWQQIAARDAVMIVYHFGKAIESVHALKGCPTLLRKIDRVKMKAALKTFEDSFPDFQYQRDTVAHSAEIQFDKRQYQKHVIRKHVELPNVKT